MLKLVLPFSRADFRTHGLTSRRYSDAPSSAPQGKWESASIADVERQEKAPRAQVRENRSGNTARQAKRVCITSGAAAEGGLVLRIEAQEGVLYTAWRKCSSEGTRQHSSIVSPEIMDMRLHMEREVRRGIRELGLWVVKKKRLTPVHSKIHRTWVEKKGKGYGGHVQSSSGRGLPIPLLVVNTFPSGLPNLLLPRLITGIPTYKAHPKAYLWRQRGTRPVKNMVGGAAAVYTGEGTAACAINPQLGPSRRGRGIYNHIRSLVRVHTPSPAA
ncbi:hypothetical protein P691DRAFT_787873 [Macrolepiota fuliginosa MF-IS2]|uniref:Uncharacterized protein n=1 Tax=Macrolepiota fuliginosa MF-IS2 TaxID=1400762 RepID=A0A9P5X304_9AGAR|nr:hypothetical protein P691DRAFT_787873 [Macrolepiota fuliginosa MF-IS2]